MENISWLTDAIERKVISSATGFAAAMLRDIDSDVPPGALYIPREGLWKAVCEFALENGYGELEDIAQPDVSSQKRTSQKQRQRLEANQDRRRERFARLLRVNRARRHDECEGAFPDPLRMGAAFAANPDEPSTHLLTRAIAVRLLGSAYNVEYDGIVVNGLRRAYEHVANDLSRRPNSPIAIKHSPSLSPQDLHFIIDCLCVGGWCERVATKLETQKAFLKEWIVNPYLFGLKTTGGERSAYRLTDRVKLWTRNPLPSFGEIVRFAFAQPTGLPGLDHILGGLLPTLRLPDRTDAAPGVEGEDSPTQAAAEDTIVTMLAGPPGSGKTSLAAAAVACLYELGAPAVYLTVEEQASDVGGRIMAGGRLLTKALDLEADDGFADGLHAVPVVRIDPRGGATEWAKALSSKLPIFERETHGRAANDLPKRVIAIDSITTLLAAELHRGPDGGNIRTRLIDFVRLLRQGGGTIFLIGTANDSNEADLAYLVDNVLKLDLSFSPDGEASRTITVEKTRQQLSSVGRHELELKGFTSVDVHPSLSTRLERALLRDDTHPKADRFIIPSGSGKANAVAAEPIAFRDQSHVLIVGVGSAWKARMALGLALERRIVHESIGARSEGPSAGVGDDAQSARRTLVISFLYSHEYYAGVARDFLTNRYPHWSKKQLELGTRDSTDTFVIPPGSISPARVIDEVERRIMRADLEGLPFDSAVIDGVHNVMVQFPNLEASPLFIPTLTTILRKRPMSVFLTFTRFSVDGAPQPAGVGSPAHTDLAGSDSLRVSQQLLYHLLVSRFDYVLGVQRRRRDSKDAKDVTSDVRVDTAIDSFLLDRDLIWSRDQFAFSFAR